MQPPRGPTALTQQERVTAGERTPEPSLREPARPGPAPDGRALCASTERRPRFRGVPDLGVGLGLRIPHYDAVLGGAGREQGVGFFEVISENFMVEGGRPLHNLDRVRALHPLILHGVSLSIGGPEPLDREYLKKLKALVRRLEPAWLSDHFCWCGAGGAHLHDLLPLPYTDATVRHVAARAREVQDYLEVPFALENTSSYLTYTQSSMSEWEFITRVLEAADCGLMFDVNNVYVSAFNHDFDPLEFVRAVPHERIVQIHLAGHTHLGRYIIDTHRGAISEPVLALYAETLRWAGPVSTLIEWDDQIPSFERLAAEAARVRELRERALAGDIAPLTEDVVDRHPALETSHTPAPAAWQQGGPRTSAAAEPAREGDGLGSLVETTGPATTPTTEVTP